MIRVYPVPDGIIVRWSAREAELKLERSIHSDDQYRYLADVTGRTFFKDTVSVKQNFHENIWYRLVEIKANGQQVEIGRARVLNLLDATLQAMFNRIQESMNVLGTPVLVMHARVSGKYCPKCYNFNLRKATDPRCPVCYGTGFEGGYLEPISTFAVKRPIKQRAKKNTEPIIQTIETTDFLIMSSVPVSPKDLVIDLQEGGIYRINMVTEVVERGFPMYQEVSAKRLHNDSPEYKMDFSKWNKDFRANIPRAELNFPT